MTALRNRTGVLLGAIALLLGIGVFFATSAQAANITVTTGADDTVSGDGECTLREAVNNANADIDTTGGDCAAGTGADVIGFSTIVDSEIALAITGTGEDANGNGDIDITDPDGLTINGGVGGVTITNGGAGERLLHRTAGALTITDVTLTGGQDNSGGGLFLFGADDATLTNVTITNNQATGTSSADGGGGVYVDGTAIVQVFDSVVDSNSATNGSGSGGGVLNNAGDLTLDNTAVRGNAAASEGGGLWNSANGTLTVLDGFIGTVDTPNVASGDDPTNGGGGIFNDGGTLNLFGGVVTGNQADGTSGSGGGLFSAGGDVSTSGTNFAVNAANRAGGGIEVISGTVDLFNSVLQSNDVNGGAGTPNPGNGGGLHVSADAEVTLRSTQVGFNLAASEGGGLWNSSTGTMTFTNPLGLSSTVQDNTAYGTDSDAGGGGIFNNGGTLTITDTDNFGNSVPNGEGSGGGILSVGGTVDIDDSTVTGNDANRAGGGIELITGTVTITNTDLSDNTADGGSGASDGPGNGGGLHVSGTAAVTVDGATTVHGNVAASEGGGLWNSATGTLSIVDAFIGTVDTPNVASGPLADDGGGGIFNNGGTVTVTDTDIFGNSADTGAGSGGGVFSTAGTVTITDSLISDNDANRAGGGIEVIDGTLETIDTDIVGNAADGDDGTPGNGGGVHVSGTNGTQVTIRGTGVGQVFVTNNTAASEGGGLWNQAGSTMTVSNMQIGFFDAGNTASGDDATNGGGGIFNNGGTVSIFNTGLTENSADGASGSGGGLFSTDGTVTITNSGIRFGDANRAGGGIEVIDGTIDLANVLVSGNSADGGGDGPGNGGGIHVSGGAAVNVGANQSGGTMITDNTAAVEGGGLWNQAGATMTVSDGAQITGNTASGPAADDGGGGIFNNGGTLSVTGALVTDNVADGAGGSGGGIFSTDGTVTIDNSEIGAGFLGDGNTAVRAGGGIEIVSGTLNVINGSAVGGNEVVGPPGNGGGIHVTDDATVLIDASNVDGNRAAHEGGGLWNSATGTMTVQNGSTVGNGLTSFANFAGGPLAHDGGGGIFNDGGTLTISDTTMNGNQAEGAEGSGGGILSIDGDVMITDSLIQSGDANRAGGGIEIVDGTVDITDTTLFDNDAGSNPGNGGGLHVTGGATVSIDNTQVDANIAGTEGGGLWNSATGTMTVHNGSQVTGNTAAGPLPDDGGGGLFNDGGILNIHDTTTLIDDNRAPGLEGSGGGIMTLGGTVTISDAVISNNRAQRAGGGIENDTGEVNIINAAIHDNAIGMAPNPGNGGGIHIGGAGSATLAGTSVRGNTAEEGGGLWNSGAGTLILNGTTVVENAAYGTAPTTGGGGIFQAAGAGTLSITGSGVTGNSVPFGEGSGAGIMSLDGTVMIDNSDINANDANRAGGGIELVDGTLTVTDSRLFDNVADGGSDGAGPSDGPGNGGGIHTGGTADVSILNSTIRSNTAEQGGGVWDSGNGTLFIDSSTLSGNAAFSSAGGGLYADGGSGMIDIVNSTISGNSATVGSGAFDNAATGTFTLSNVTVTDNDGTGLGGASYMTTANSLIANRAGGAQNPDCDAPIDGTSGNSLDSDGTCGVAMTGDPLLSDLGDYGGDTLTHLPIMGSPAAGIGVNCESVDQRGITRNANCTAGSVEIDPPPNAPVPPPLPPAPAPPAETPGDLQPGESIIFEGDDVIEAAITISMERFEADGPSFAQDRRLADYVLLSRVDLFADTLSASSLTANGPLLFTQTADLDPRTRAEVDRVLEVGDLVYILGGTQAISPAVQQELIDAGYEVVRVSGASRVETSVAVATVVANRNGSVDDAVIARANADAPTAEWADSVTGGAWAGATRTPVLLTQTDTLHPAVAEWLAQNRPARSVVLGGVAAISQAVFDQLPAPERFSGPNRYATAATIASDLWVDPRYGFLIGSGSDELGWATGLAAAGLAADLQHPLLLVEADRLPEETDAAAACRDGLRPPLIFVRSDGQISDAVVTQLSAC